MSFASECRSDNDCAYEVYRYNSKTELLSLDQAASEQVTQVSNLPGFFFVFKGYEFSGWREGSNGINYYVNKTRRGMSDVAKKERHLFIKVSQDTEQSTTCVFYNEQNEMPIKPPSEEWTRACKRWGIRNIHK